MKTEAKLRWSLVLMLAALMLVALVTRVDADEGHGHNHHDDGDSVVTTGATTLSGGDLIGGDISTGGNKSIALVAPGLGDVDIAQCLGSEAWTLLVGGKQKLVLNQVCMAEFYLKQGRYDLAAQALCNQPEILKEYGTESACEIEHDFTPPTDDGTAQGLNRSDVQLTDEDDDIRYAVQQEEIEYAREERASMIGQLDYITQQIERSPAPQVQQQIDEGEDRRARAKAALEGDENDG